MAWTAPKTDWDNGALVTAEDMNVVGENLAALRNLPIAIGATIADITVNTGNFVDVDSDNLNLTITTTGGIVMVHFHGSVFLVNGTGARFDLDIDGMRQGDDEGIVRDHFWAGGKGHSFATVSFTRLFQNLSAGSHTFKLQWRTEGEGGAKLNAGAQFWVREI